MAKKSSVKKTLSPVKLIIMAVIVIALVASVGLVKKNQENRSKAAIGIGFLVEKGSYVCGPSQTIYYCNDKTCSTNTINFTNHWVKVIECDDNSTSWNNKDNLCIYGRNGGIKSNDEIYRYWANCKRGTNRFRNDFTSICNAGTFDVGVGACIDPNKYCSSDKTLCCLPSNIHYFFSSKINKTTKCPDNKLCSRGVCVNSGKPTIIQKSTNTGSSSTVSSICGTTANTCKKGILDYKPADSVDNFFWTCKGVNGDPSVICRKTKQVSSKPATASPTKINGVCSTTLNVCKVGTMGRPIETATSFTWQCYGKNGGATALCKKVK